MVLGVTAVALALTACDPPGGPRVLILGDSVTVEAKGSGNAAEILKGYRCPLGSSLAGSCDVSSSGAVRLTLNIRDGIKAAKAPPKA